MAHIAATTAHLSMAEATGAAIAGLERAVRAACQAGGAIVHYEKSVQPPPRNFASMGLEDWKRYAKNTLFRSTDGVVGYTGGRIARRRVQTRAGEWKCWSRRQPRAATALCRQLSC
eukprot:3448471-Pleurochrysis_carterae.AAC.3